MYPIHALFISKARLKLAKSKQKLSNKFSSSMLSSKDNRRNKCFCFNDVIWSMAMKMRLKMKNRSQGYDINRPRPRMGPNILNIKCV